MADTEMASLLETGKFSDLKLVCQGKEYLVHKAILCTRSGFFEAACRVDMKEKADNTIVLHDAKDVVECLLEYCYSRTYPKAASGLVIDILRRHVDVSIVADKYDLKDYAVGRFRTCLARDLETQSGSLLSWGRPLQYKHAEDLFHIVEYIYANTLPLSDPAGTPSGLRKLASAILWQSDTLITHQVAWKKLLSQVSEYAADLADHKSKSLYEMQKSSSRLESYRCRYHGGLIMTTGSLRGGYQKCATYQERGWDEHCEFVLAKKDGGLHDLHEEEFDAELPSSWGWGSVDLANNGWKSDQDDDSSS